MDADGNSTYKKPSLEQEGDVSMSIVKSEDEEVAG